jgi:hypothetical protein
MAIVTKYFSAVVLYFATEPHRTNDSAFSTILQYFVTLFMACDLGPIVRKLQKQGVMFNRVFG